MGMSMYIIILIVLIVLLSLIGIAGHASRSATRPLGLTLSARDISVTLINMDKNQDRLAYFTKQYKESDLSTVPFQRFSAVDGKKLEIESLLTEKALQEILEMERTGYRTKHYQLSRGAVGCYISHMNVFRNIAEGDAPYGLVFEDDVVIPPSIWKLTVTNIQKIPPDWDIVLLGCYCIVCKKHDVYSDTNRFFFMHAYVIKKDAAKKILAYLDNRRIDQQIDSVLSRMTEKSLLKIVCLNNAIARQSQGFKTTIQVPLLKQKDVDPYAME